MVSVLCKVNGFGSCTEDIHAVFLQIICKVQRCLTAELCNNSDGLFLFMDRENIFECKRLKIELVGSIIVCGNGFGVTVYDNRLKAEFFEGKCRMNTAVVKFDTLTDSVGTSAENHNLFVTRNLIIMIGIIVT